MNLTHQILDQFALEVSNNLKMAGKVIKNEQTLKQLVSTFYFVALKEHCGLSVKTETEKLFSTPLTEKAMAKFED